jgi:6-phosphogluconolactonase
MSIRSFSSLASLSATAAQELARLAKESIAERGRFTLALSGGKTPRALYEILARDYATLIDWSRVHLFWGDERNVPHNDLESNYRMVKESLLDRINIPLENVHAVPILMEDTAATVATRYAAALQENFGQQIPEFDLILLGLGSDGHTASLFPGMTEREMNDGIAIATHSPVKPFDRISLTLPVINNASNVFFLVAGAEKKQILKSVLAEEGNANSKYPASCVSPSGELVWFVDEAAMS